VGGSNQTNDISVKVPLFAEQKEGLGVRFSGHKLFIHVHRYEISLNVPFFSQNKKKTLIFGYGPTLN
jgi:hypothetical protein